MNQGLNNESSKTDDLFSKAGNKRNLKDLARTVKESYDKTPSDDQAYWYLTVLNEFIFKHEAQSEQDWAADEALRVYSQNSSSEALSIEYLKFLYNYISKRQDTPELKNKVNQAKAVYEEKPSEDRASWYLAVLNNYVYKRDDQNEQDWAIDEAGKIYEENPASETIPTDYLKVLHNYILKREDNPELKNIVDQAKKVYDKSPSDLKASWYLSLLNNYISKREDNPELKNIVDQAKMIYEEKPSEDRASGYLNVLKNYVNKRDDQNEKDLAIDEAKKIYEENSASENLSIEYLKVLNIYMFKREDNPELKNKVNQAKVVYEEKPSEDRASWYLAVLNNYVLKRDNQNEQDWAIDEAGKIYEENPASETIPTDYLKVLHNYILKREENPELKNIVDQAKKVYEQIPSDVQASWYLSLLNNYISKLEDDPGLKNIVDQAKMIYEEKPSENRAYWYYLVLNNFISKRENQTEKDWAIDEAGKIYEENSASENLSIEYLKVLNIYMFKREDNPKLKNKVDQAKAVYKENPTGDRALWYLAVLTNYIWNRENQTERDWAIDEAGKIYEENPASETLSIAYLRALNNYIFKREDDLELKNIVDQANLVFEVNPTENRASWYLAVLNNYMWKIGDKSEQTWAIEKASQIYKQYQSSNNIASIHLGGLIKLTKKLIDLSRMKEITKLISGILRIYPNLADLVVKHIDQLLYNNQDDLQNCTNLLICLAEQNNVKDHLMRTKYGILFDFNKIFPKDLEKLVQIFSLVQTIKNQLIVKDPKELTFGHYTSAKVLQLLLKQEKEKEEYAVENSSRLNNVNYMNDPSEGKVLNQFLKLDTTSQKISLKASPWFLMSLTTEIDRLEMWAQYGKQGEGVCLVLDSSDFLKVNSYSDMGWITAKRFNELPDTNSDNTRLEEVTSENKLAQGDYIYRIGYLELSSGTAELLTEQNNDELKDVIDDINQSLISLREKVKEIDKETILYEKVDECLEEIRYLFKSADYKYEKELRILKFVPLEANNKKIKIDESEEVAKLYIERDNPIQIAEVIFGPKFSKPENVTPLLQLLDKNIKFSQSKIPFK